VFINPKLHFETDPKNISTLFANSSFRIPEYQRVYSWSEKGREFETLWNDIVETETNNFHGFDPIPQINQKPHFLGAVVTEMTSPNQGDVVDGQQRLTTLTILLCILYDFIEEIPDATLRQNLWSVRSLTRNYAAGRGAGGYLPRLELNQEDDFFKQLIINPLNKQERTQVLNQSSSSNNSVKTRIIECYQFFEKSLKDHFKSNTEPDYGKRIQRFTNTLFYLITVLHLNVSKSGLAYTIFETLNTRGLDLSQADLIKNKIFSKAQGTSNHQTVLNYWNQMQNTLLSKELSATEFIRYHYASTKNDVKIQSLFETISDDADKSMSILDYARSLKEHAVLYADLADENTGDDNTDELLQTINDVLRVSMSYPLLLAGLHMFGAGNLEFKRLVRLTHNFCFRYFTVGSAGSVAKLESAMGNAARTLRRTQRIQDLIDDFKVKSPDSVFEEDFKNFQAKKPDLAFYIIRFIEIHLAAGAGGLVPFNQSQHQHLEHIMPKKPTATSWAHVYNDKRYNSYLNRVGNHLVLEADINRVIKNHSFAAKTGQTPGLSKTYSDSSLKLPKSVMHSTYVNANGDWDFSSIEKRQTELAQIAVKAWSLD
jgi:uncharacterized protein with ParB-like and HNH nuclease domain